MFDSTTENTLPLSGASPDSSTTTAFASALTYTQLLDHGCRLLESEGVPSQQVRNLASALRLWIRTHGYVTNKVVSVEFGCDFDKFFTRFTDAIAEHLAPRTQRDRQEQVLRWRRIAAALQQHDNLPTKFSEALEHCLRASPLSRRQIARDSGTSTNTMKYWAGGAGQPRGEAIHVVARLEETLELPKGTLVSRLPLARRTRYSRGNVQRDRTTSFTKLRKAQMASHPNYSMRFTPRLTQQWQDLMRLKTDSMRDGARARNTWRLKPIEKVSISVKPSMVIDGQVCTTASVHWGNWSSYLGWLKLDAPDGGGIAPEAADTLAWLADPEFVIRYLRWKMRRSNNKFHNGINVFLQLVESYLRPETGYLWLWPPLRKTVPELALLSAGTHELGISDRDAWREHCTLARTKLRHFRVRAEDTMGIRVSRDPTERAAIVLHDEFPLKRLVEFVEMLERSAPPAAHNRDYCAWIRDVTLCKMMTSNPLRVGQYAAMTFRADGMGNLVCMGSGRYRLHFGPDAFKNEKGAASGPYDVEVDPTIGPWIHRYLTEARPHLVFADKTERFFLAAAKGHRKVKDFLVQQGMEEDKGWTGAGILDRIKHLTHVYIDECPGFGPHSFRHVIATDHLRRHPGDYLMVATLLHDKLETVLKNYAHLRVGDGLRILSAGIKEASEQLAAARKAA